MLNFKIRLGAAGSFQEVNGFFNVDTGEDLGGYLRPLLGAVRCGARFAQRADMAKPFSAERRGLYRDAFTRVAAVLVPGVVEPHFMSRKRARTWIGIASEDILTYHLITMKISPRAFSVLACGLLLVGLLSGCGGGPKEKVDVQGQIQNLKSENAETRQNACVELAKAKEAAEPAVQPLIGALKDQDALVRRLAAYALGEIGAKAKPAIAPLKEALNDPDTSVAQAAVNAISSIDPSVKVDAKLPPNVTN